MLSTPLESYLDTLKSRPDFNTNPRKLTISTGNWRGYVGEWKIDSEKLFLEKITAHEKAFKIENIFPAKTAPVFADWFSGVLRVSGGVQRQYQHMGFDRTYERELFLFVSQGKVIRSIEVSEKALEKGLKDFDDAIAFLKTKTGTPAVLIAQTGHYKERVEKWKKSWDEKETAPTGTHWVVAGDTGHLIAKKYKMTFQDLKRWNPDVDWNRLKIGQCLKVKTPPAPETPKPAPKTTERE
jgi:hypothetical protein